MPTKAERKPLIKIYDWVEYYEHQVEGIRKMARMSSFLLADEMGLGKSLQALTVAAIDFELGMASRVLIVCPATLKWNWHDEIRKFTLFMSTVLDGDATQRDWQLNNFMATGCEILICNYEQVKAHLDDLNRMMFDIIIYDEAHLIKNPKSVRAKATLGLRAGRHFVLTGSPMLNQVNELWVLLNRIDPVTYNDYWRFVNRYAIYGGYKGKQIMGCKHPQELALALNQVMIRRLKKDTLDLPDKQYIIETLDLHFLQREIYQEADEELPITLPDDPDPMELENALTKYLRLMQICNTAAEIEGYDDVSTKLDRLEELIAEICLPQVDSPAEPTVVWSQFLTTQRCAVERLNKLGFQCFILNGSVPKKERSIVVKQWADYVGSKGDRGVLIATPKVAGTGLNMTQASKTIFIDRLYVPKLNEQAEDRLHRIGADLTKPIQIIILVCRGTVEQRITQILQRKSKLFNSIVEESEWKRKLYAALRDED